MRSSATGPAPGSPSLFGYMKGTVTIKGDVVVPGDEFWSADFGKDEALVAQGIRLVPLDAAVAAESTLWPGEPQGDPADRFLIATARTHRVALATLTVQRSRSTGRRATSWRHGALARSSCRTGSRSLGMTT